MFRRAVLGSPAAAGELTAASAQVLAVALAGQRR
jgi:hypothetical protein